MPQDSSDPVPLRMCTSCGGIQERDGHFCERCGAPVTPHAHSDYILGIQSRGFALHKATHNPRKFIVVLGTWLWVGPSLALCLVVFFSGLVVLFQEPGMGGRIMVAAGAAGIWLFGTILYRTTSAWLVQRFDASRTFAADDRSEPDDRQDCLDCGKPFPASQPRCPACGWSYAVENPGNEQAKQ